MVCLAQNGMLGLDQLRWLVAGWVGGAFCVASYLHGHHSMWVTDAWRVLQAICQGENYTNMMIPICDKCHYCFYIILFSPQNDRTALHYASMHGHPEVVKLLLQSHADVNVKDKVSTESPH